MDCDDNNHPDHDQDLTDKGVQQKGTYVDQRNDMGNTETTRRDPDRGYHKKSHEDDDCLWKHPKILSSGWVGNQRHRGSSNGDAVGNHSYHKHPLRKRAHHNNFPGGYDRHFRKPQKGDNYHYQSLETSKTHRFFRSEPSCSSELDSNRLQQSSKMVTIERHEQMEFSDDDFEGCDPYFGIY